MSEQTTQLAVRDLLRRRFLRHQAQLPLLGKLRSNRGALRDIQIAIIALPRIQIHQI